MKSKKLIAAICSVAVAGVLCVSFAACGGPQITADTDPETLVSEKVKSENAWQSMIDGQTATMNAETGNNYSGVMTATMEGTTAVSMQGYSHTATTSSVNTTNIKVADDTTYEYSVTTTTYDGETSTVCVEAYVFGGSAASAISREKLGERQWESWKKNETASSAAAQNDDKSAEYIAKFKDLFKEFNYDNEAKAYVLSETGCATYSTLVNEILASAFAGINAGSGLNIGATYNVTSLRLKVVGGKIAWMEMQSGYNMSASGVTMAMTMKQSYKLFDFGTTAITVPDEVATLKG